MHYKTNRLNHDFQIAYFIAGSCHTPDAAYAILCDLRDDRANALKTHAAGKLREKAKRLRAEKMLMSDDEATRLEGQADLTEADAMADTAIACYDAAVAELAMIERCMAAVETHRKFAHLPLPKAHEAAQSEEWKLELIHRAENHLLTTGTIATDHFATMRLHPEFHSSILPAINEIRRLMGEPGGQGLLLNNPHARKFDLPRLLENLPQ